jgi:predicted SPOUT superfamily RNA methylase MTH1
VTVHFPDHGAPEAAHPKAPRLEGGLHWGYDVRRCGSLSSVFTESPFEDGYDVSIGTSERGTPVAKAFPYSAGGGPLAFSHMLVVFGGPRGIEWAASNDGELAASGITTGKTKELFDHWVNVLPNQGSRGIRTDEAVFIALTALRRLWEA